MHAGMIFIKIEAGKRWGLYTHLLSSTYLFLLHQLHSAGNRFCEQKQGMGRAKKGDQAVDMRGRPTIRKRHYVSRTSLRHRRLRERARFQRSARDVLLGRAAAAVDDVLRLAMGSRRDPDQSREHAAAAKFHAEKERSPWRNRFPRPRGRQNVRRHRRRNVGQLSSAPAAKMMSARRGTLPSTALFPGDDQEESRPPHQLRDLAWTQGNRHPPDYQKQRGAGG
ncbi:hypothetical protein HPB47_027038 [Ixodes persulcatus]|uniref:Uncharacterized protein n=1 Tax=Ixodes persulcatus TaxID=34615 RepID=A0AC60PX79_IXOPE|nr:hypothetical protein HPB47_027038 [Ixodes persulcatus]